MSPAALLLALAVLARVQGEVAIVVEVPAQPVAPGAPFEISVHRDWDAALVPAPFEEGALTGNGLVVQLQEVIRGGSSLRVEEHRRYVAQAHSRRQIALDSVVARATSSDGRVSFEATALPRVIALAPTLAADDASPLEWPADFATPAARARRDDFPSLGSWIVAALALLATLVAWLAARGRGAAAPMAAAPMARGRLAALALAEEPTRGGAARRELCAAIADVVRATLEEERAIPASRRTREEVIDLARSAALPSAAQRVLSELLERADAAKFKAAAPSEPERLALIELAQRFLGLLPAERP